jgi:hypothetical protein
MVVTFNKRQKMSSNSNDDGIHDLPVTLFASISEYLALPSRILFAVAMTPSNNNSGLLSAYILPSSENNDGALGTLDFSTIERDICEKLTDCDIYAVLLCINAQRTLKKLILTGCTNITGKGLEPLRGSSVLEMIDLSLVRKFQNPKSIEGKTALSEEIVIPILQSIVDAEGCSLRHVNLHETWRDFHPPTEDNQLIRHFVETYSEHLNRSSHRCSGEFCEDTNNVVVFGTNRGDDGQMEPWFYGNTQGHTCNQCGDMFCQECDEGNCEPGWCNLCQRAYCKKCVPSTWCNPQSSCRSDGMSCSGCLQTSICRDCGFECCTECISYEKKFRGGKTRVFHRLFTCDQCGESICTDGCIEADDIRRCTNCKRMLCCSCCVMFCCANYRYECFEAMCSDCRPRDWKCMWCCDDDYDPWYPKRGQRCASCYADSATHCSDCHMKKLFEEDYKSPSIPNSYWIHSGFDEVYAKEMEGFLWEMKKSTLQLMSGDRLRYDESISLRYRREQVVLQHDDILLPHWEEFINALRQYNHEPTKDSDRILYLRNVRLHSSVMDKLTPVLQMKGFTLVLEDADDR